MALPEGYKFPSLDTLKVATWNLEHFVDRYDNPYIDAEREDSADSTLGGRIRRAAEGIQHLDADLLVLQEAEGEAFLRELSEKRLEEMGYRFVASTESPSWYMNVVLLSRFPLGKLRDYSDVTTPIVGQTTDAGEQAAQSLTNHRLWMADVRVGPDEVLTVAGAHLKAGREELDRGWRTGQIQFLHAEMTRLLSRYPERPLMVVGDLNSLADSPELRLLLNDPSRPAPDSLLSDDTPRTARLTDPLSGEPTHTHPSGDPVRQLDYILPNQALTSRLIDAQVARPLPPDSMAATSDHLPVSVSFERR